MAGNVNCGWKVWENDTGVHLYHNCRVKSLFILNLYNEKKKTHKLYVFFFSRSHVILHELDIAPPELLNERRGHVFIFFPGFRWALCPNMFPGMWHNLGTRDHAAGVYCMPVDIIAIEDGCCEKQTKLYVLVVRAAQIGCRVEYSWIFSHSTLTLTSLLWALSCSAGQCQHR